MRNIIITVFGILYLTGCASTMESRLNDVRSGYMRGEYIAAADEFSGNQPIKSQDNLELLITADALFHADETQLSDNAYEEFNHRNIDTTGGNIGREATAIIAGNMANDYRPYMMDTLFVSYYQLWDAIADGRFDDARVIINQSYARQQKMSREYADMIADIQKSYSENTELVGQIQNENRQWAAFRDIMNPALTYLSGLYFLNTGDMANAKTYLRRANGMMPENTFIRNDMDLANAGMTPSDTIWIFIEDGFAPGLREERINAPYITGNGIGFLTLAISRPVFFNNKMCIDGAQLLANVDAMFLTEYEYYRINEALRAFSAAVARVALQSTMYNSGNDYAPLMGLGATLFSTATTNAEVRTWATLPQNIYLMRVENDKSGLIELKSNGNLVSKIEIPKSGNVFIYVRITGGAYDIKVIQI